MENAYLQLLDDIMECGEHHEDRTGVGTKSLFGYQIRHDMTEGFPLLTTKKVPFRWVAEELFWFLSGSTNEKDLRDRGVDIWKEWATAEKCALFDREEGDLGPVYGKLWRDFGGVDQISYLISEMSFNPNSRRLIVTGWHPEWQRQVALPPCHTLWQMRVHNKKELSLGLYARSIDAFLGLPFNIASYALLLELFAKTMDLKARDLVISFGDVHIYRNHFDQVREQLKREPFDLPKVNVKRQSTRMQDYKFEDLDLVDYKHHPKIEAEVAV